LGNNAGLSLETSDMEGSQKILELLGFKVSYGSAELGWLSLQNEDSFGISLMKPFSCPHLFFNPSSPFLMAKKTIP